MENFEQNLIKQNELLLKQNKLLEEISNLTMKQKSASQGDKSQEIFVENIDRDEMRNGFLVTKHRKKLWNVQIGLINEFARICKKHNLRWFACDGTLLGAVRHKGFIPWDDDVDINMFRPDYNKFLEIAPQEIEYPYFFDNWYNYRRESDETQDTRLDLPFLSKKLERDFFRGSFVSFPITKIKDLRTTMIEVPGKVVRQGIWIDIFPMDILPPFDNDKQKRNFDMARELLTAVSHPEIMKLVLQSKMPTAIPHRTLREFLHMPFRERGMCFDKFAENIFSKSQKVGDMRSFRVFNPRCIQSSIYNAASFEETIYLPFEKIELPAPANYDDVLRSVFGDWHKMIITHHHTQQCSVDIPYTEYYEKTFFLR